MPMDIPHGTFSAYSYRNCRCDICVEFKRGVDRAYYLANREKVKARVMARHDANREAINAQGRARKASRSELEREADRAKRKAYLAQPEAREKLRERLRKYNKTAAGKEVQKVARARHRGAPFTAVGREYAQVLRLDPCSYCGRPGGEIDHIVPVADGGSGEWDNLTAACRSCNNHKSDTDLLGYLLKRAA